MRERLIGLSFVADRRIRRDGTRLDERRKAVLGLATGSTPVKLYRELIRFHREQGLSFKNVVSFNLDEYYGLPPNHPESYHRFMEVQLFKHVDIPRASIHVPDGLIPRSEVYAYCQEYEGKIEEWEAKKEKEIMEV